MDKDMSSISNKIKPKIKTPIAKTVPIEKTISEYEPFDFRARNGNESPQIKSNDNNYIPDFSNSYVVPHGINTLNINFPSCYHDRRPTPLQMSTKYPFQNFGLTPTSTAASDVLSFKGNKTVSKNYNISEFIQPDDKNLIENKESFKRKINFEEENNEDSNYNTQININNQNKKSISIEVEEKTTNFNSIPYIPAIELKTPPHYKFNQLKNISSSFASCFVPNTNDYNMYRPISTTHVQANENIFRSPNDLKKKIVTVDNNNNKTNNNNNNNNNQNNNLNSIENNKISSANPAAAPKPKIVCNCKKSKCLKLYCECFILGLYCDGCNCSPCFNNVANAEERNKVMDSLREKNPSAFKPKIDYNAADSEKDKVEKTKHMRGCNCSKTQCLKKYCECYQSSVLCTSLCKCTDCKNDDIERLKKKPKSNVLFKTVSSNIEGNSTTMSTPNANTNMSNVEKNSFGQEFFTNKHHNHHHHHHKHIKEHKEHLKHKSSKESKEDSKQACSDNNNEISENSDSYDNEDENQDEVHLSFNSKNSKNSNRLLDKKRKRPDSDDKEVSSDLEEILTPKFRKDTKKKNKDINNNSQANISTGPFSHKKRMTKINEDSDNKIAKKLNMQF